MFWTPGSSLSKSLTRVFTSVRLFLVSQLGEVMVSMASNLTLADERVLWMAQREALACSRIIACLQKIAVYRLATEQAFFLVSQRHWPYFFFFFWQRSDQRKRRSNSLCPRLSSLLHGLK